jgi:hypothetical protein
MGRPHPPLELLHGRRYRRLAPRGPRRRLLRSRLARATHTAATRSLSETERRCTPAAGGACELETL